MTADDLKHAAVEEKDWAEKMKSILQLYPDMSEALKESIGLDTVVRCGTADSLEVYSSGRIEIVGSVSNAVQLSN